MEHTDEYKKNLWLRYQQNKSQDIRNELIEEYSYLVKLVAGRMSVYLGSEIEFDDLVGYGCFGLIDAIDKYDITRQMHEIRIGLANRFDVSKYTDPNLSWVEMSRIRNNVVEEEKITEPDLDNNLELL